MALNQRQREQLRALCGELHDDDGVDPKTWFKSARQRDPDHRKARQLCRQVQKTLDLVLSGATGDDLLTSLRIVSVTPGRDSSRLLVIVAADVSREQFDRARIETQLALIQGRLRGEVSAAITRKKTPLLTFQLLDPGLNTNEDRQEAAS